LTIREANSSLWLANCYGVKVQRNATLLHRSKTTIRQPHVKDVLGQRWEGSAFIRLSARSRCWTWEVRRFCL